MSFGIMTDDVRAEFGESNSGAGGQEYGGKKRAEGVGRGEVNAVQPGRGSLGVLSYAAVRSRNPRRARRCRRP